jgi:hypothetical protein
MSEHESERFESIVSELQADGVGVEPRRLSLLSDVSWLEHVGVAVLVVGGFLLTAAVHLHGYWSGLCAGVLVAIALGGFVGLVEDVDSVLVWNRVHRNLYGGERR